MFRFNIPNPNSIEVVADWAELFVAFLQGDLSKSQLSSYIEESSGDEASDTFIASVWQELEKREILYGDTPPFKVENRLIKSVINWKDYPEYTACLIFSLVGNPVDTRRSGKLFERIANEALKNFISGKSIIYGYPSCIEVNEICNLLNEKFNCDPPRRRRDRDLDVIAWKPFDDLRASQLIILMQCASGHDWRTKIKDLNLDAWCRYIHFACKPIKGFSVPVIISDEISLQEISLDAGLIMDRARLYRNSISFIPTDNLRTELKEWCERRMAEINA